MTWNWKGSEALSERERSSACLQLLGTRSTFARRGGKGGCSLSGDFRRQGFLYSGNLQKDGLQTMEKLLEQSLLAMGDVVQKGEEQWWVDTKVEDSEILLDKK